MITLDDMAEQTPQSPPVTVEPVSEQAAGELDMAVEALLFVSAAPVSVAALAEAVGCSQAALREAIDRLRERYAEGKSGIVLGEVAGGFQLRSAESQRHHIRRLLGVKPQRLTRAAMETLALVAYRQPITRPEIEDVRGVDCGAVLKALLERGMLRILGKKEEPGRPLLYGTTREFLTLFGLSSLSALPTLREFRELSEENRSLVERETGSAELPPSLTELADDSLADRLKGVEGEEQQALADLEAAMAEAEARANLPSLGVDGPVGTGEADAGHAVQNPNDEQGPPAPSD
jgi:segregation and condensation protein B